MPKQPLYTKLESLEAAIIKEKKIQETGHTVLVESGKADRGGGGGYRLISGQQEQPSNRMCPLSLHWQVNNIIMKTKCGESETNMKDANVNVNVAKAKAKGRCSFLGGNI
jgi:hypothetical protein